jgi:predicted CXXCH cytochrome family protein
VTTTHSERTDRMTHGGFAGVGAAIRLLAFLLVVGASFGTPWAQDPPHWAGAATATDCTSQCHVPHQSEGEGLTSAAGNVNLCQSCHDSNKLPITNAQKATPGSGGISHAFDVNATNPAAGALPPVDNEMLLRVMNDNVVCSTCHNQHKAEATHGGRSSIRSAENVVDGGGAGTVTSGGTFSGSAGLWYLIDIVTEGDDTSAEFRYSKDNGISWTPTGAPYINAGGGSPVELDNGVEVTFSGGAADAFRVGERWEFSAAWSFLRRTLPLNHAPGTLIDAGTNTTGDAYCRDCHRSWVMTHTDVQTWDDTFKSHPVGVTLDANGQGYDRTTPLDGNGLPQNGGASTDVDGNPTNDLTVDAFGFVQCLSCHGVHYVDSNTLTVDGP